MAPLFRNEAVREMAASGPHRSRSRLLDHLSLRKRRGGILSPPGRGAERREAVKGGVIDD
jgi:hypothetical protein